MLRSLRAGRIELLKMASADGLFRTDPDALVFTRRRGVECSMESDRPGMLIRKHLMQLLAKHGESECIACKPWRSRRPPEALGRYHRV